MKNFRIPLDYKEDVKRSVRDMSLEFASDIHACLAYPVLFQRMMANDNWEIDFKSLLQSNPLVAPLMGQYIMRVSFFKAELANYYGWMLNNSRLNSSDILNRKKHTFKRSDLPNHVISSTNSVTKRNEVERNSFFEYMGLPAGYIGNNSTEISDNAVLSDINAERALVYLDVIRNYYTHSQMDYIPYMVRNTSIVGGYSLTQFKYADMDKMFKALRTTEDGVELSYANIGSSYDAQFWLGSLCRGGLFCAQYEPDMLVNLLRKVDSSQVSVDTSNGSFTIDTLRFQNKLQRLVDRYDVSGGRFSSWLKTVFGAKPKRDLPIPQFIGTTSIMIDPTNITSVSNTFNGTPEAPLGSEVGQMSSVVNQFAGQGRYNKNYKFYVHADEPCYLIAIMTLVPKVYYSQGIDKDIDSILWADDYTESMSNLGYQDVPRYKYSMFRTHASGVPNTNLGLSAQANVAYPMSSVVGKQIAWMDLMSNVSRSYGGFAVGGDYDYFILNRRYYFETAYDDDGNVETSYNQLPSPYADPSHWQYPFALTSLKDHNFFLQMQFSIRAVRPIGKSYMPTLD